jgi:TetR/AcrR family transcriptional repressor for divergent bdcA
MENALATAQALFHEHGYDALGVAAITQALGINPPSFYAAFGSKAGLFERIIERYSLSALPMDALLAPGRDPAEALTALLETAAQVYTDDPAARGCLVLEAARSDGEPVSRTLARRSKENSRQRIHDFVARTHPRAADAVADYAATAMSGLSASAREGWDGTRLTRVARAASGAFAALLGTNSVG